MAEEGREDKGERKGPPGQKPSRPQPANMRSSENRIYRKKVKSPESKGQ